MKPAKNSLEYELALVSAPEDFPSNLRSLSDLDSSLRCPICKDFYSAPVVIHIPRCCHTFCSACIRTCFNNNSNSKLSAAGLGGVGRSQRCPVCKIEAHEEKLKPVPTLETAVASWREARDEILGLIAQVGALEDQLSRQNEPPANDDRHDRPCPKRIRLDASCSPPHLEPTPKQADLEPTNGSLPPDAPQIADEVSEPRRTRAAARSSKEKARDLKPPTSTEPSSLKRKHQSSSAQSSASDSDIEFLGDNFTDPNASVSCPLCGTQLANSRMDAHVTRCLSGTKPTGTLSFKPLSKPLGVSSKGKGVGKDKGKPVSALAEKLPLPHFASLKPKDLRAELMRHRLSADGSKDAQTRRLSHFLTLFNANLDADPARRKSTDALRTELAEWERLLNADAAKRHRLAQQPGFAVEHGKGKCATVVTSEEEYLERNKDQFAALIVAARAGRAKQASAAKEPSPDNEPAEGKHGPPMAVEPVVDKEPAEAEDKAQMTRAVKEASAAPALEPELDNESAETEDGPHLSQHQDPHNGSSV